MPFCNFAMINGIDGYLYIYVHTLNRTRGHVQSACRTLITNMAAQTYLSLPLHERMV